MKNLYRSREHKMLGGVAGGLGEYFDIDPIFIRIFFVVTLFTGGIGIIAYIILWIITPKEPIERFFKQSQQQSYSFANENENSYQSNISDKPIDVEYSEKSKVKMLGGITLMAIGIIILFDKLLPDFDFAYIWSGVLVFLGIFLIFNSFKRSYNNEK